MKRTVLLALSLSLLLSSCAREAAKQEREAEKRQITQSSTEAQTVPAAQIGEALDIPWCALAVTFDGTQAFVRGEKTSLPRPPLVRDGVVYLPAGDITALLGGSFVRAKDVWYLNCQGNVSVMMEEYNVLLFNTDPFIMDSTPLLFDGELYLPTQGLGKALSMRVSVSPSQRVIALGSGEDLSEEQLRALRVSLGGEELPERENAYIAGLAQRTGAGYEELQSASLARTLYESGTDGRLFKLWTDCEGGIHKENVGLPESFSPEGVFILRGSPGNAGLYDAVTGKEAGGDPEELLRQHLRSATARYMELLAAWQLEGDEKARSLMPAYLRAIEGQLEDGEDLADVQNRYETHVFDRSGTKEAWQTLYEEAQIGDFMLFSAEGAGAQYGCFNHSSLIIGKENGVLRLLHARGSQYGVGADLEMDALSFESLCALDFYLNYGLVYLCTAGQLGESERVEMTRRAYEKYNGYQFGYGGRMGLEEVNCTELIDDAYMSAGVDIIDGDYDSRLKEVLRGNTKNLVLIPDDLLFSGNAEVKAVWKR